MHENEASECALNSLQLAHTPTNTNKPENVCMWLIFFWGGKKRVVFLCECVCPLSECVPIRYTEMCSEKSACGNVSRALRLVSGPSINSKATGHCCNKGLRCKSACTCRAYHQIQIPTTTALCKPALRPEENLSTCTCRSVWTLYTSSQISLNTLNQFLDHVCIHSKSSFSVIN